MAEATKIQWTHATFNPWRGCLKVSPECANCYADTMSKRNPATLGKWGSEASGGTRVVAAESYWRQPVKWNREAEAAGERRRVFCASLADVFEDWKGPMLDAQGRQLHALDDGSYASLAPGQFFLSDRHPLTMADVRRRLFALIDSTPWLDWLILTKRPQNIERMWWEVDDRELPREKPVYRQNCWLLTSAGTQATADEFIPELLKCRDLVPFLGVSAEPLLEAVDFTRIPNPTGPGTWDVLHGWKPDAGPEGVNTSFLDWVIVGGESGHGARPCDISWIRSIRDQCTAAGVSCFIKQLGSVVSWNGVQGGYMDGTSNVWPCATGSHEDLAMPGRFRKHLIDKKGGAMEEWPSDLHVREFPK